MQIVIVQLEKFGGLCVLIVALVTRWSTVLKIGFFVSSSSSDPGSNDTSDS